MSAAPVAATVSVVIGQKGPGLSTCRPLVDPRLGQHRSCIPKE